MSTVRVAAYPDAGPALIFAASSIFEAQYILDQFQSGAYVDPTEYRSAYIEIKCSVHGWQTTEPGTDICGECLDEHFYPPD